MYFLAWWFLQDCLPLILPQGPPGMANLKAKWQVASGKWQVFTVESVKCVATQLLQLTQRRGKDCERAGRERRRLGLLILVQLGFRTS